MFSSEPAAFVDLYFYHSGDETCEAALNHFVLPAVHLDIPIPKWDTCFLNMGCCNVKMECLPDGRLQQIHYADANCTVPKMINTNHTNSIFENGGCNAQGENFYLAMKWDPKYCAPTHRVTTTYLGCYQDSQARVLSYQAPNEFGKSLTACATHCLTL